MVNEIKITSEPAGKIIPIFSKEDFDKLAGMCSVAFVLGDKQREPNKEVYYVLFGNQWFSHTIFKK
jgi:hypothetical protein